MLIWPHEKNGWGELEAVESVFMELVKAVLSHQELLIICRDHDQQQTIKHSLSQQNLSIDRCRFAIAPSDDCWARDSGPVTVFENKQPRLLDFRFNGWGEKYPHANDDKINLMLKQQHVLSAPLQSLPLILEGGSIECDGNGTLLTTESCLLSKKRNSCYNRDRLEQLLKHFLGADTILWLQYGSIHGDDTDGHIDMLARFCANNTIAYSCCDNKDDVNYAALKAMENELESLATARQYKLVQLPLPQPIFDDAGLQLPASYANFVIINDAILCPQYHDDMDDFAVKQLQALFPEREIIGINALPIIHQHGSLHCLCMNLYTGTG